MRTFEDMPACRTAVPLLLGIVGPSGGGKTNSAFRLATGIQRVTGGEIYVIDTESNRSLHYAPRAGEKANPENGTYDFRHLPFGAPFGPLDYLAAIEHCAKKGAKIVIVDGMSNEHEGVGGVLEQHDTEWQRLGGRESTNMLAWGPAKRQRKQMINSILQLPIASIFCFRAKDKIKMTPKSRLKPGEEAVSHMGYMPIAGEEFIFEMTVNFLLLPRANGVPTWRSEEIGERATMKCPRQFLGLFADAKPLSEDTGEALARWAAGGAVSRFAELSAEIAAAHDQPTLDAIALKIRDAKKAKLCTLNELNALASTGALRKAAIAAEPKTEPVPATEPDPGNGYGEPPPDLPATGTDS